MRLGIQSQRLSRDVLDFAIRARVAGYRAIDAGGHNVPLLQELRAALPDCKIGLRLVRDVDLSDPKQAGLEFYNALRPKLLEFPYDFCSGGAMLGYHADTAERYSEFNALLATHIRIDIEAQVHNVRYVGFDFGVTWPNVYLVHKYEAGWKFSDAIGMQLYKLPQNADENTIYHHRQVWAALPPTMRDKPVWATEFGLDVKGLEGDGWHGPVWNWTSEQYAAWLKETALSLTDVELGFIYLCNPDDPPPDVKWESWNILRHPVIADAIRQANEQQGRASAPPASGGTERPADGEAPPVAYKYVGFEGYAYSHPEVGQPAGEEQYDGDGNLRQLTEHGELIGLKAFSWKVLFLEGEPNPKARPSGPII